MRRKGIIIYKEKFREKFTIFTTIPVSLSISKFYTDTKHQLFRMFVVSFAH